jgi:hypothetical protein
MNPAGSRITPMNTQYLSCADTAKLVRAALKRAFPGVKFSVRSSTYAGGASMDVGWTDGPAAAAVDAVIQPYSGAAFDGSIDLKTSFSSWLLPDGSAVIASHEGTQGSGGFIPAVRQWMPHPEAKLVRFGADFIRANRTMSAGLLRRAVARLAARGLPVEAVSIEDGRCGGYVKILTWDRAATRGFDMEREVYRAAARTHCITA